MRPRGKPLVRAPSCKLGESPFALFHGRVTAGATRSDARAEGPLRHHRPGYLGSGDLLPGKAEAARAGDLDVAGAVPRASGGPGGGRLARRLPRRPPTEDEKAVVRVLGRERDRAVKVPAELGAGAGGGARRTLTAWKEARERGPSRPLPGPRRPAGAAAGAGRRLWPRRGTLRRAASEASSPACAPPAWCRCWRRCPTSWSRWWNHLPVLQAPSSSPAAL